MLVVRVCKLVVAVSCGKGSERDKKLIPWPMRAGIIVMRVLVYCRRIHLHHLLVLLLNRVSFCFPLLFPFIFYYVVVSCHAR